MTPTPMSLREDLALLLPRLKGADLARFCAFHARYEPHLDEIDQSLYARLDAADRPRFVQWMLKRWGKIDLVNPVERRLYDDTIAALQAQERPIIELDGRPYWLRDMRDQGYDFKMLGYDWWLGAHDIRYAQYEHGGVQLQPDDVIIDAGAFIGDTAVYFHHKLQGRCQVHSFELLPENLALLLHNLERNGVQDGEVVVNQFALSDQTGQEITVADGATQGSTSMFGQGSDGVKVQTVTLDDYVVLMGMERLDLLKMDIEGAEVQALQGAQHTIRHFRPRLAICIYHRWDDVFKVPRAILATGVDYRFGFKWVQLKDGWEAILLAEPLPVGTAPVPAARRAGADPLSAALGVLSKQCASALARADAAERALRQLAPQTAAHSAADPAIAPAAAA
ncbi:FkbM family methyltransferase [Ideonella sp. 4Y11]|uniref:FkbM family methyltransferase n=1 Tax=Ideonella aquatica TaxID=2824119 RepID=A0A940YS78_9BURK|nr:FkbM family methyltransferase [Ideonella aquatica]MBQ0958435.1 FkbM family methyltransferase [Ideonella aquatica]